MLLEKSGENQNLCRLESDPTMLQVRNLFAAQWDFKTWPENVCTCGCAVYKAVNGVDGSVRRCEPHSESSSSEDQELEEERRILREQLSKLPTPKVQLFHDHIHIACLQRLMMTGFTQHIF